MPARPLVINLLLKGDTTPSEDEYLKEFSQYGLRAVTIPVLRFEFVNLLSLLDLLKKPGRKGLIVTSPRVVEAIAQALRLVSDNAKLKIVENLPKDLVFAVGERTGSLLESLGIAYNQESAKSGNAKSLLSFIQSIPAIESNGATLIYPHGNLTDASLFDNFPYSVESVMVYETHQVEDLQQTIPRSLKELDRSAASEFVALNLIFFSPSGLNAFLMVDRQRLKEELTSHFQCTIILLMSSIGQTTKQALEEHNITCFCVSEAPKPSSLVECVLDKLNKLDWEPEYT